MASLPIRILLKTLKKENVHFLSNYKSNTGEFKLKMIDGS